MQVIILGRIDEELDDDVFVKVMTANFLTVKRQGGGSVTDHPNLKP